MKKFTKKIITIVVILLYITSIMNNSFATLIEQYNGDGADVEESGEKISDAIGAVLSAVRYAGVGIATVILLVIATKYLLASAGERADIKKYAVSYVTGAVILFAASGIIGIIKGLVSTAANC